MPVPRPVPWTAISRKVTACRLAFGLESHPRRVKLDSKKSMERGYSLQFARRSPCFRCIIHTLVLDNACSSVWSSYTACKGAVETVPLVKSKSGFYSRYFLVPKKVQVQDLFVTYTIIQRVLTSSEMWVRSAPWTVQYYRKNNTKKYT